MARERWERYTLVALVLTATLALGGCGGISGWMHNDNMGGLSQGVGQIMGGSR